MASLKLLSRATGSILSSSIRSHSTTLPVLPALLSSNTKKPSIFGNAITKRAPISSKFYSVGTNSTTPPPSSRQPGSQQSQKDDLRQSGTKEQAEPEEDAAQGMDLFAAAIAQQKREAAAAAQAARRAAGEEVKEEGLPADLDANEAEKEEWKRKQAEEEQKELAKSWRNIGAASAVAFLIGYIALGFPDGSDNGKEEQGNALVAWNSRVGKNFKAMFETWTTPTTSKLLPDPLPAQYQRPITLCIELTDALIHMDWDKASGWRVALRPGVKQFLSNLSRSYEVVVYTTQPGYLADPVMATLDPHFFYAMYRLYRDHTSFIGGDYVKDLSKLNRDLGKTVIVDIKPESFKLQPENGLLLKPWKGQGGDRELARWGVFLEELAIFLLHYGVDDVRPLLETLKKLDPEDSPTAWSKWKDISRAKFAELSGEKEKAASPPSTAGSWIRRLFGGASASVASNGLPPGMPSNIIDQIEWLAREERALAAKEHEDQLKQMAEVQKQQEEYARKIIEEQRAKGLKLVDYMMGAGQPPVPGQPSA
ncbi:mitochondrial inner membrane protein required for protein import [Rhizophlyctis rosea]|uniref:Mitochondrial import inner membrane translocase subunit TIM50 n=1 Tax=Rhizophlyctis rosea TaxID=64517 RepID=A0AAD5X746_9FUNG|nr:mitochondrial inner membrane protein required for protein import [Rhizophlyctis rosea]